MDQQDMGMVQCSMSWHSLGIDTQSMYLEGRHSFDIPGTTHHHSPQRSRVAQTCRYKRWLIHPVCIYNR